MAYNDCSTSEKERSDASDGNYEDGSRADLTARSPGVDLPSRLLLIAFEPAVKEKTNLYVTRRRRSMRSLQNTAIQIQVSRL